MGQNRKATIVKTRSLWDTIRQTTLETYISLILKLLLLIVIPVEVYLGQYAIAAGVLLTLIVSFMPAILSRSLHINLPWEIDLIVTIVIFAHAFLGYFIGLYQLLPFFDKILHFASTVLISLLSFMIIYSFYLIGRVRLSYGFMSFFIIITAVGIGGIWEIIEYTVDSIFSLQMQNGLNDTMFDLIFDTLGGIAAAMLGQLYIRYSKPAHRRRFAVPISQLFGYISKG